MERELVREEIVYENNPAIVFKYNYTFIAGAKTKR